MPNRTDMDVEPSISETQADLVHGTIGLCTGQLAAGTSMVYRTANATINVRGRRLLTESHDAYTRAPMLEGESTVRGGEGSSVEPGGQTLAAGQQAIIRPGPPGEAPVVEISDIPPSEKASLGDEVSIACLAKRTVYFDVGPPGGAGRVGAFGSGAAGDGPPEIVPVEVVPADLPVQYTVSPASLAK